MRVIRLTAENIKRLTAVDITPDPNMVVITGPNSAGKSSILDCILYALKGGRDIPEEPIRTGEDKGGIRLELEDYIIIRNFTKKGNYLKVYTQDGVSLNSPQALLDSIVGTVSFDPLEFSRGDPKKQRGVLLELAGVDTTKLDNHFASLYEERTMVGREVKRLQGVLSELPYDEAAPKEEVSVTTLSEKLQKAVGYNAKLQSYQKEVGDLEREAGRIQDEMVKLEDQLTVITDTLSEKRTRIQGRELVDTNPIIQSIRQAEETNKRVVTNKKYTEVLALLEEADNECNNLADSLHVITAEKQKVLNEARMPIKGLTVTDNGVLYNNIPLEQASDGEKLMIGVGVSMALNPEVRVIRITDGSLIDSTNLRRLEKLTKDKDFQVWVEMVGERDEEGNYPVGLYIEEGSVVAIDGLECETEE